jgi:hypothetical protein
MQYHARWRVISGGTGGSGATYVTQTLSTSSTAVLPTLMKDSTGQVGNAFIYRNQIYTMGSGFAGIAFTGGPAAYGVNGSDKW